MLWSFVWPALWAYTHTRPHQHPPKYDRIHARTHARTKIYIQTESDKIKIQTDIVSNLFPWVLGSQVTCLSVCLDTTTEACRPSRKHKVDLSNKYFYGRRSCNTAALFQQYQLHTKYVSCWNSLRVTTHLASVQASFQKLFCAKVGRRSWWFCLSWCGCAALQSTDIGKDSSQSYLGG